MNIKYYYKIISYRYNFKYGYEDGDKRWYRNGLLHCDNGPAVIWDDRDLEWWTDGVMVSKLEDGNRYYYKNRKYNREDGPAIELSTGDEFWYLNGFQHRDDGPACEYEDGTKEWWFMGRFVSSYYIK